MDEQKMKTMLIETFNTVSDGYDNKALRFFPLSAEHMAALLGLRGNEHVLDVACGTGHASLAIAHMLPHGSVTAVDFSSGMLDQARRKAASLNVRNIDFTERDMQDLGFESQFDVAICAFGIFFVMDMNKQLAHIASAVKAGGRVVITSFVENYFLPLRDHLFKRLSAYGVQDPPVAWKRVASADGCRHLFESAGLRNIRVEQRNVGYYLKNAEEWWNIVWNAGFRRYVTQLSPTNQEQFKREHLQEVELLGNKDGIWLDVGVLYTIGTK